MHCVAKEKPKDVTKIVSFVSLLIGWSLVQEIVFGKITILTGI